MITRREMELLRRIAALEDAVGIRTPQLTSSSLEDGALLSNDTEYGLVQIIGKQYDGTNVAASVGGPPPPQPQPAAVFASQGGLRIVFDGEFEPVDGFPTVAPMDFQRFDIVVGTSADFDAIATPPSHSIASARGGEVFLVLPAGVEHWVAVVARSLSGKASTPSTYQSGIPLAPATSGGDGGGNKVFYTNTEPIGLTADDTNAQWFDTDDGNHPYRWDGALLDWVDAAFGGGAINKGSVGSDKLTFFPNNGILGNVIPDPNFLDEALRQERIDASALIYNGEEGWSFESVPNMMPTTQAAYTFSNGAEFFEFHPGPPRTIEGEVDVKFRTPTAPTAGQEFVRTTNIAVNPGETYSFQIHPANLFEAWIDQLGADGVTQKATQKIDNGPIDYASESDNEIPCGSETYFIRLRIITTTNMIVTNATQGNHYSTGAMYLWRGSTAARPPQRLLTFTEANAPNLSGEVTRQAVLTPDEVPVSPGQLMYLDHTVRVLAGSVGSVKLTMQQKMYRGDNTPVTTSEETVANIDGTALVDRQWRTVAGRLDLPYDIMGATVQIMLHYPSPDLVLQWSGVTMTPRGVQSLDRETVGMFDPTTLYQEVGDDWKFLNDGLVNKEFYQRTGPDWAQRTTRHQTVDNIGQWAYAADGVTQTYLEQDANKVGLSGVDSAGNTVSLFEVQSDGEVWLDGENNVRITGGGKWIDFDTSNIQVSEPLRIDAEYWHIIGNAGEPGFENGWTEFQVDDVGFIKDAAGVVHLRGRCVPGNDNTIFTLPPGYRPENQIVGNIAYQHVGASTYINIQTDGRVQTNPAGTWVSLASVHFPVFGGT